MKKQVTKLNIFANDAFKQASEVTYKGVLKYN